MTATTKLDDISAAIEQAVKALRGGDEPARKRMKLDEFVTFAVTEIQNAAADHPAVAKRRLIALKRSVDDVIASVAKLSADDSETGDLELEVTTAFAPTKADGDTPMDDLTTTADQSSTEIDLATATTANGDSVFAKNLDQVAKAIEKLNEDLRPTTSDDKRRGQAKKRDASSGDDGARSEHEDDDRERREDRQSDPDGWPLDLATQAFLDGDVAATSDPVWGYDPSSVASNQEG